MTNIHKISAAIAATLLVVLAINFNSNNTNKEIPLIAIANYGPHSSLQETIDGIKSELTKLGYIQLIASFNLYHAAELKPCL